MCHEFGDVDGSFLCLLSQTQHFYRLKSNQLVYYDLYRICQRAIYKAEKTFQNFMITLRCTKKLQKFLEINLADNLEPTSAALGDWYANLIPTFAGDLIIFVNEKSLLSVAMPIGLSENLFPVFRIRVANLLRMIGIHSKVIENELRHFDKIQFGKTVSRSVLGSMNDFAWRYQIMADEAKSKADLSLSKAELKLSQMPCKPLDFSFPSEIAQDLLSEKKQNTS